jgi:hypothetical protein
VLLSSLGKLLVLSGAVTGRCGLPSHAWVDITIGLTMPVKPCRILFAKSWISPALTLA